MGNRQFGFEISSLGVKPGVALAVGAMLIFIVAMTAFYLSCYYWARLARMPVSPSPEPSPENQAVDAATCKILMNLAPSMDTPRCTVVMMPGNSIPMFLAMPCHNGPTVVDKRADATSGKVGLQSNVEVKLEL